MTIDRVNPSNWGVGDKLTSAQQNQGDTNWTYCYDIRDYCGDILALSAVLAPAEDALRFVLGHGWYRFKASATTGLSPFRVAAADMTPGGWVSGTAHEETVTRYIPGSAATTALESAAAPTLAGPWSYLAPTSVLYKWGGSLYVGHASTHLTDAWGFQIPLDHHLIHGANLSEAVMRYTPADASAPAVMPQFALARSTRTGSAPPTIVHLLSTGFLVDSGAYAAATDKNVTYTVDQNGAIDLATYSYSIVVFDEHGTGASAGNMFHMFTVTMDLVPDARR